MNVLGRYYCFNMKLLFQGVVFTIFFIKCLSFGLKSSYLPIKSWKIRTWNYNVPISFQSIQVQTGIFNPRIHILKSNALINEIDTESLPNKSKFQDYFNNVMKKTNIEGKVSKYEIRLNDLLTYGEIQSLIKDGLINMEDINDLWSSSIGDATGLTFDEAYEFMCMVLDLPDPEDQKYFHEEFDKLKGNKNGVTFMKLLQWQDIQDMLNEEALTMEDVNNLWKKVTNGDLNAILSLKDFVKLNLLIDEFIEDTETSVNEVVESDSIELDVDNIDVWSPQFQPSSAFEPGSLAELQTFWATYSKSNLLSKEKFVAWNDIQDLIKEGVVTTSDLDKIWREGVDYMKGKSGKKIDYDTFLRLNVKIDLMIDSEDDTSVSSSNNNDNMNNLDEEPAEVYYTKIFKDISNDNQVLSLSDLFKWSELQDLIDESLISTKAVIKLYEQFPQSIDQSGNKGISVENFIALNTMLDVMIDKSPSTSSSSITSSKSTSIPSVLVSDVARPLPAESELKMGMLGSDKDDVNDSGEVSQEELDLMTAMDKADSLLNAGSFQDFDELIGDTEDPRLVNAKELVAGGSGISKELRDVLNSLYHLAQQQPRAGLIAPEEDVEMKLRDLSIALLEKAPKVASMSLSSIRSQLVGKWKLLYSNSEMFRFYNGITGFANVFPGTSFQELELEYSSDGYLNEAKYYETLKTPLGPSVVIVYSNWDLMKETSFITNENSVMLRGYCTKVTAGPMEYRAEENWKSLRTLAMNEVIYVDNDYLVMRNAGALRIYFILARS